MTELEFIIALRRILMSALDLIDKRYGLGKYAGVVVPDAGQKLPISRPLASEQKTS